MDQDTSAAQTRLNFAQDMFLYGATRSLQGLVNVTNAGEEPIRVQRVTLRLGEMVQSIPVFSEVAAGQKTLIRVNLPISIPLPPGTHEGEIEVAGVRGRVMIEVTERVHVRFTPRMITLTSITQRKSQHTVIVSNHGNVPLVLPERVAVGLAPSGALSEAIHYGLRTAGKEGFQKAADAATARMAELDVRPAVLSFAESGTTIEPGANLKVTAEIKLPRGLRANLRYTGTAAIYNAKLRVVIQGYGAEADQNEIPGG